MDLSHSQLHTLKCIGVTSWIVKDLSWTLLFPFTAFPAAVVAMAIELYILFGSWRGGATSEFVHLVAGFAWLLGNFIWMVFEFGYQEEVDPGRVFPWHHASMLPSSMPTYDMGCSIARTVFVGGLIVLFCYYAYAFRHIFSGNYQFRLVEEESVPTQERLAWGVVTPDVYTMVFICPWLCKEISWTLDYLPTGLLFAFVAECLILDAYRRYGDESLIAEAWWILGNAVWMFGELALEDQYVWTRYASGAILLIALNSVIHEARNGAAETGQRASPEKQPLPKEMSAGTNTI